MKVLVMMAPHFTNYEEFKKELYNQIPNVMEICYYGGRIQHSEMCEIFSLEEFEMPCTVFHNENPLPAGDVSNATVTGAAEYVDAVIWFSHRATITHTLTVTKMLRLNKKVFHVRISSS